MPQQGTATSHLEHYKTGNAEKALVNIIKNSLQAIRLQQYLWRKLGLFFLLHLYFYLANEGLMSHRLVT